VGGRGERLNNGYTAYDETDESLERFAADFLGRQKWCAGIINCRLRFSAVGYCNVYFAEFEPLEGASSPVWIVVGNLPPGFVFEDPDQGDELPLAEVLDIYAEKLDEWVDAAQRGEQDLSSYVPVMYRDGLAEMPPTPEIQTIVRSVIEFLRGTVIPDVSLRMAQDPSRWLGRVADTTNSTRSGGEW
jgi:hypothetical protein